MVMGRATLCLPLAAERFAAGVALPQQQEDSMTGPMTAPKMVAKREFDGARGDKRYLGRVGKRRMRRRTGA
jgi:hypothetical protein